MSQRRKSSGTPAPAERIEPLASSLHRAFPLPESGRFDDLLQALGVADGKAGH